MKLYFKILIQHGYCYLIERFSHIGAQWEAKEYAYRCLETTISLPLLLWFKEIIEVCQVPLHSLVQFHTPLL